MPSLADVLSAVEYWYPPDSAESWDAVGLTCGDPNAVVQRVLLAVDCVPETVTEAVDVGAQLLLTHHPLLMAGVHSVAVTDPKGAMVHRMIVAGTAHYAAHTNADIAVHGVSDALATLLGLEDPRPLDPRPDGQSGLGRIGLLAEPVALSDFVRRAAEVLPKTAGGLRASGNPGQIIKTVAVCGGSGGSYAALARTAGADVLLTADLRHHSALEAVTERTVSAAISDAPMALVDAAHWATEWPWLNVLAALLRTRFRSGVDVIVSEVVTDPWTLHLH